MKCAALLTIALVAACTYSEPADVFARKLEIVSGNNQTGVAGAVLEEPYVVRLSDHDGRPIENFTVSFVVVQGNGTLSPTERTDAQGEARTYLTLDTTAGSNNVAVDLVDTVGAPLEFAATGIAGP